MSWVTYDYGLHLIEEILVHKCIALEYLEFLAHYFFKGFFGCIFGISCVFSWFDTALVLFVPFGLQLFRFPGQI